MRRDGKRLRISVRSSVSRSEPPSHCNRAEPRDCAIHHFPMSLRHENRYTAAAFATEWFFICRMKSAIELSGFSELAIRKDKQWTLIPLPILLAAGPWQGLWQSIKHCIGYISFYELYYHGITLDFLTLGCLFPVLTANKSILQCVESLHCGVSRINIKLKQYIKFIVIVIYLWIKVSVSAHSLNYLQYFLSMNTFNPSM